MKIFRFKLLPVIICFITIQIFAYGQQGVIVSLDSIATIEFPVKPHSLGIFGARRITIDYNHGTYGVTVLPIGYSGNSMQHLENDYKYSILGATAVSDRRSVTVTNFEVSGLLGKEIVHQSNAGKERTYYRTKLLHVNGTNYNCTYTTTDLSTLYSEPVNRFINSLAIDSTVALKQYGDYYETNFVKKLVLAWKIIKLAFAAAVILFFILLGKRIVKKWQKADGLNVTKTDEGI